MYPEYKLHYGLQCTQEVITVLLCPPLWCWKPKIPLRDITQEKRDEIITWVCACIKVVVYGTHKKSLVYLSPSKQPLLRMRGAEQKSLISLGTVFWGVGVGGLGRRVPSRIHERGRRNWAGRPCNPKVKENIRLVFFASVSFSHSCDFLKFKFKNTFVCYTSIPQCCSFEIQIPKNPMTHFNITDIPASSKYTNTPTPIF